MHVRRAQSLCRRNFPAALPFAIGDALAVRGTAPFTLSPALTPGHRTHSGTSSTLRTERLATTSRLERPHALAR
jgi:hypothetical protein